MKNRQRQLCISFVAVMALLLGACAGSVTTPDNVDPKHVSPTSLGVLSQNALGDCSVTVSFSVPSPQNAGGTITVTGNATCTSGTPEYKFYMRQPTSNAWILVQDWSASNTYSWDTSLPNNNLNGDYIFQVWARRQGETIAFEGTVGSTYTIQNGREFCGTVNTTVTPASPQAQGTVASFASTGVCTSSATPEFKIWRRDPAGTWTMEQDWTTNVNWTWNTATAATGTHLFQTWVRAQGTTSAYDSIAIYAYTLNGPGCTEVTASFSPASPQATGTAVTATMAATCFGGVSPEFKIYRRPPGGSWALLQDWTASTTYNWATAGETVGTHQFQVWMRAQGTTVAYDAVTSVLTYELTTPSTMMMPWAAKMGGSGLDQVYGTKLDSAGNVYIVGSFSGSATFGSTTLNAGGPTDIFVAKLDKMGNWMWAKQAGGAGADGGRGIALDASGNVYISGYFQGAATFGSNNVTGVNLDAFIAKLDNMGNWQWVRSGGGSGVDYGFQLAVDGSGNTYLVGFFQSTATFGSKSATSNGSFDVFVAKLDNMGNWQWVKGYGGSGVDYGYSIALASTGDIYISGSFEGTMSVGSTNLSSNGRDGFVVKLNAMGTAAWAKQTAVTLNNQSAYAYKLAVDSSGNVIVVGYFNGVAAFGSTSLTSSGIDVFVSKLTPAGAWTWSVKAGGSGTDYGYGVATSGTDIYISGAFTSAISFGSTNLTGVGTEGFVAKLDSNGNFTFATSMGGGGSDYGQDLAVSGMTWCVVGYFQGSASFGSTSLTSAGGDDGFVWYKP